MQFLIDHLIAIVVGSVLLSGLLVLQLRGNDAAITATAQYRTQMSTGSFATTLEREIENMRSRTETENAFAASALPSLGGGEAYRFRLRTADDGEGGVYTSQFSFPTLTAPDAFGASAIIIVSYLVEPTGQTTTVDGRERALYRATRHEFRRGGPVVWTDVIDGIVDFDVTMFPTGGPPEGERQNVGADMATAETPPRVQVELRTAPSFGVTRTGQAATSTRHARSIRIPAAMAAARPTVPDATTPGGIPLLPGDPGAAAALPESAAPSGGAGGTGGTTGGGTGGTTGGGTGSTTGGGTGGTTGGGTTGGGTTGGGTSTGGTTGGGTSTGGTTGGGTSTGGTDTGGTGTGDTGGGSTSGDAPLYTICHVTPNNQQTLRGTIAQLLSHRAHSNDYFGACR
ncbi:hypothetical protein [Rubrivirga sp. IMCC45206]|uniref:hypothetical protein n=1 Tax=Rubrivirga sp. IMCC45206 TaxID=3391614 RepID=UPI00398FC112